MPAQSSPTSGKPENIKAMSAHRGLAIFYFLLAVALGVILVADDTPGSTFVILLFPFLIGAIHAAIAFGARRSAAWARACSIAVACLMLLAVPIGTLIGVYLLLNSEWPKAAGVSGAVLRFAPDLSAGRRSTPTLGVLMANKAQWLPMAMATAALILWVCSLFLTGLVLYSRQETLSGLNILAYGWLSPLELNFAWFANVFFLYSAVALLFGGIPLKTSVLAVLLSFDTVRFNQYLLNEGGATTPIYGYGWGAVLWFIAIFLMLAAVGARRRQLAEPRDWLQPAGFTLVVLTMGFVAYSAFHDRAIANPAETQRLTSIAFKRGKVCSAVDPVVDTPIKQLVGPVEIVIPKNALHASYPFEQVESLLDWGIPRVRYKNIDYSLALYDDPSVVCLNLKDCKGIKGEPPNGPPAAMLYVTEVYLRSISAKLVEAETGRTVFDHTWMREDHPVNTNIYCPAYESFPSVTEQPRLLLIQALNLRAPAPSANPQGAK